VLGDGVPADREPSRPKGGEPSRPRDRDLSGRPRNARPRDGLGRPLDPADVAAGQDRIPDDLVITGRDAAVLADRLLRDGRPFHAHEVLEAAWKSGPRDERDLWQGLAQIAVGLTHARRGNARGAVTLLRRGTERIRTRQAHPGTATSPGTAARPGAAASPGTAASPGLAADSGSRPPGEDHLYGMDIPAVLAAADDLASRIEQRGLDHIPGADFAPRLLAGDR
jgi:hypothetical protein